MNNVISLNHEETLLLLEGILNEYDKGRRTFELMGSEQDLALWHASVQDLYDRLAALFDFEKFETRLCLPNTSPTFENHPSPPN